MGKRREVREGEREIAVFSPLPTAAKKKEINKHGTVKGGLSMRASDFTIVTTLAMSNK